MDEFLKFWPVFSMILGASGVMFGFMLAEAKKQIKETQKELSDFKVSSAEKYASREDLRLALDHINSQLQRLNEKLDKMRDQQ